MLNINLLSPKSGEGPEKKKEQKEKKESVENRTIQKFEEHFGLTKEELKDISKFNELDENQKALVLNYMEQDLMTNIVNEGLEEFNKESAIEGKSILEKTKSTIKKSPKLLLRNYYIAKREKGVAKKKAEGGARVHGEKLKEISKMIKDSGIRMEVNEKGEIINYIGNIEGIKFSEEEKKTIDEFNKISKKFTSLPLDWDYKKKNKFSKLTKIEKKYGESRNDLINLLSGKMKESSDKDVLLNVAKIDEKINMDRFFKSYPDVEKSLSKTKKWWKPITSLLGSKSLSFGAGFGVRAALTGAGLLNLLAAPISGGLIGGYFARKRAIEKQKKEISLVRVSKREEINIDGLDESIKKDIKHFEELHKEIKKLEGSSKIESKEDWEKSELKKKYDESREMRDLIEKEGFDLKIDFGGGEGGIDKVRIFKKEKEVLNFVEAESLTDKINGLIDKIDNTSQPSGREEDNKYNELKKRLGDRIYYTQQKIDSGTVKFSSADNRLSEYYNLNEALIRAKSMTLVDEIYSSGNKVPFSDEEKKIREMEQEVGGELEYIKSGESKVANLVKKKLNQMLDIRDEKNMSEKQKKVFWQTMRGAITGAGFAYLGAKFRNLIGFSFKKVGDKLFGLFESKGGVVAPDIEEVSSPLLAGPIATEEVRETLLASEISGEELVPVETGEVLEEPSIEEIMKREGLTIDQTIENLLGGSSKIEKLNIEEIMRREGLTIDQTIERLMAGLPKGAPLLEEEIVMGSSEGTGRPPLVAVDEVEKKWHMRSEVLINKGGNLWDASQIMVKSGDITKEEFWHAWRDSIIELEDGRKVPIHKLGLIHEGDVLVFDSKTGLFEISNDSGKRLGSDEDLYEVYKNKGKEPPKWLRDEFGPVRDVGIEKVIKISPDESSDIFGINTAEEFKDNLPDILGDINSFSLKKKEGLLTLLKSFKNEIDKDEFRDYYSKIFGSYLETRKSLFKELVSVGFEDPRKFLVEFEKGVGDSLKIFKDDSKYNDLYNWILDLTDTNIENLKENNEKLVDFIVDNYHSKKSVIGDFDARLEESGIDDVSVAREEDVVGSGFDEELQEESLPAEGDAESIIEKGELLKISTDNINNILEIDNLEDFESNLPNISENFDKFSYRQQYQIFNKLSKLADSFDREDHTDLLEIKQTLKETENSLGKKLSGYGFYSKYNEELYSSEAGMGSLLVIDDDITLKEFLKQYNYDRSQKDFYDWVVGLTNRDKMNRGMNSKLINFIEENYHLKK